MAIGLNIRNIDKITTDWQKPAWISIGVVLGLLLAYRETFWSMAQVWWSSDTFGHGLLIFPISAWLIWEKRHELAVLKPQTQFGVLGLILIASLGWFVAQLLELHVLSQLMLISLLILAVWCMLGSTVARVLAFPMGFLFFAIPIVPVEEALLPHMMHLTADAVVKLLRATGLSVYQEGINISIASGNWSVVEECSGVHYQIACLTLGCLFAYRAYRSLLRRLLFVGFAIVLPVFANILRAYIIILIGHLSGNKLAVGIDHVLLGVVFFGIVITIMFYIGSIWSEPREDNFAAQKTVTEVTAEQNNLDTAKRFVAAGVVILLVAGIWPSIAFKVEGVQRAGHQLNLVPPVGVGGWRKEAGRLWGWWPRVQRVDAEFYKFYSKNNHVVELYVGQVMPQRSGVELTDSENVIIVSKHSEWRKRVQKVRAIELKKSKLSVVQNSIQIPDPKTRKGLRLLIWHWYRIGDRNTSSPYIIKLFEIWSLFSGARDDVALIVMATNYDEDLEAGADVLRSFAEDMLPEVDRRLDEAVGHSK